MPTYKELQDQIQKLQQDAEEARLNEVKDALANIRKLMADYELSIDDIQAPSSKKKSKLSQSNIQFRDESGNTWSGRGRMPAWIKGKDKEQFRVG